MHVLATFTHHDPDPPAGGAEGDAASAAALGALDAAIADQPLPDIPEPKPAAQAKDGEEPPPDQPDLLDQALQGDPAGETPEARQARELAEKQATDKAAKDKADADAAAAAEADANKTDAEKAEDARKAKVDADVQALRDELKAEGKELSPKGEARFRAAAETISQQEAHLGAVSKTLGIDFAKPEEAQQRLAMIRDNAQAGVEMVNLVMQTGAQPEQYTMALDYLAVANKANQGDVKAQEQALKWLLEEVNHYAGLLGRDITGLVDPLAAHADLQRDVAEERITRERALELAAGRNKDKMVQDGQRALQEQQQRQTQQTQAQEAAINAGREALNQLGPKLAAADPGGAEAFKAKGPQLIALVKDVTAKFPPDQWVAQVSLGYLNLKAPTPAAPAPGAGGGPLRPAGPVGVLQGQFDDPYAALDAGIAAADQGS